MQVGVLLSGLAQLRVLVINPALSNSSHFAMKLRPAFYLPLLVVHAMLVLSNALIRTLACFLNIVNALL